MEKTRETRQTRTARSEFRSADGEAPVIRGYFAVFGDTYELWPGATESIDPHAFDGAIVGEDIRCLVDHDTRMVLGRTKAGTLDLRVDAHGLYGEVQINPDDAEAMNLYARVKRGDVDQCSFGFDILEEDTEYREDGSVHWTIKKVKLYEVSCVTFPAYKATEIEARKADFEQIKKRSAQVLRENLLERMRKAWH